MTGAFFEFMERHSSIIITTHDPADPDGLGAEKLLYLIAKNMGKQARIVNSGPIPENFRFMDTDNTIENWENVPEALPWGAALVILDTSDEYNIGELRDLISHVPEVFIIDHHEPNAFCTFNGFIDNTASSVCELLVEMAETAGVALSPEYARAAYAGIVFDTGYFAYPKTTARTFRAALSLVDAGVNPYEVYSELDENTSVATLLLQKKVISSLEIYNQNRVAVQIIRKSDLDAVDGNYEDTKTFINLPMKGKEVEVSILLREVKEGQIRCSLRSKGKINVSKLAQTMGGGGHVTAAGFKSTMGINETLDTVLKKVSDALEGK
jgi:phosphoesterase RecJ-like protein